MQRMYFSLLMIAAVSASSCSNNNATGAGSSAAADASAGGSGSDVYYEYTSHSSGKEMTIDGSSKLWISATGKMRKETWMASSMRPDKGAPIVVIADASKPYESILIDDSAKTWSVNHVDTAAMSNAGMKVESTVSKMGDEKIMGFTCVHARIISHKNMFGMSQTDTIDLYKSNEVPVPSVSMNLMNRMEGAMGVLYSRDIPAQLKQMGCDGFLVKMEMHGKDVSSITQLTKVEKKDLPGSLFETPAGYKEDKNGGF